MKKLFTWIVRIAVLLLLVKIVMWSWDKYQSGGREAAQGDILDYDKVCRITNPDTGSCVCMHKRSNERLDLPYEECVELARGS